ncbi:MAG: 3-isopropylmalate dehydratase [Candidatus Margulisiibacteriota bacterium]|nr:MAG: 3-isopropylmalate dehydratase [Candidatus Margulisbacteria bacterium GWD2_39_127]PZM79828.1 MAG: 3-isopropylmalate dehydratase [Candidatus Margulisiibacteriota bacterium]HAR62737.1 3-isopropylmalate dehydratase [Candidatus Margulisiibacteriota bacterium]HCY37570.1 3-isopropylmalate dehydratase [Candidatus Margulisiibacteriota bacterium]
MGMTITEKILAKAAGKPSVIPGENVWVNVHVLMTHDVCGPGTIGIFEEKFGKTTPVFDKENVIIIPDHYIFTKDEKSLRNIDILRDFVKRQKIKHFYDPGTNSYSGVCHVTLPEEGHVRPGEVILGTDSHTCTHGALGAFATGVGNTDAAFTLGTGKTWLKVPQSIKFILNGKMPKNLMAKDLILHIIGDIGVDGATYKAMEFEGETIENLSIDERMTICNMAIEAGGKNGIIAPDIKTIEYIKTKTNAPFTAYKSDPDAQYSMVKVYDVSKLEPCVAAPHSPDKKILVNNCKDVKITRAYIGSCTGGKITDFIAAASILNNKKVAIETYVIPSTIKVEQQMNSVKIAGRNLMEIFKEAGCLIGPASCAACLGGPVDTFGRTQSDEVVISTTNRNFPGRMGSKDSSVYLASPYTVAATALNGYITDPIKYL